MPFEVYREILVRMSRLKYNRELYSKTALLKAAYFFSDRSYIHLDADETYFYVSLTPKPEEEAVSEEEFTNEMLAQSVRHEVYLQTRNIRELLLARAMSTSLVTGKEVVTDDFTPKETFSEDAILKDWFEEHDEAE